VIQQMRMDNTSWQEIILPLMPVKIRKLLEELPDTIGDSLEEIRLRAGKPLMIHSGGKDYFLDTRGNITLSPVYGHIVAMEDCQRFLENISDYSLYAIEEELRNGYITLKGGFRIGIVGKAVLENRKIKLLKYCSGFNIRITRQILGAADKVMPYLVGSYGVRHTLVISPPQLGKTTMLRDIARQLSNGWKTFNGVKVGIVDERSEIAGCYQGIPQNDIGVRTDVLDACPKAEGILMLIRSMSPQVIVTDEIGRKDDIEALEEALNAGVKIITSAHGGSLDEVKQRPFMKELIEKRIFERYILLGNSKGVGTVESILEGTDFHNLLKMPVK
jgi:stage III sporulation protein AA